MNPSPPVFLSHSKEDKGITDVIRQSLERSEIGCWIAPDCIPKGHDWAQAIDTALDGCSVVLCILSSRANESKSVAKELNMAFAKEKIIIPLRIEDVEPSGKLRFYLDAQWIDALKRPIDHHLGEIIDHVRSAVEEQRQVQQPPVTASAPPVAPSEAANGAAAVANSTGLKVRKAAKPQKVALLYRRNTQPDDEVLTLLEQGLREAGHNIFVDRHMSAGVEWVKELDRQVRESDAVIPLLSALSVQSDMLSVEVQTASDTAQQYLGKPRILPVRVNYEGAMPEPYASLLNHLQYVLWRSPTDNQQLLDQLLDGLDAKVQPTAMSPEQTEGPVPLDSKYYIVQPTDLGFQAGIQRKEGMLLIKGARQMGKTSLLARGLKQAREAKHPVILLDMQKLNQSALTSAETLYKTLGSTIAKQIGLKVYPQEVWAEFQTPNQNFEDYVKDHVMTHLKGHVVLAMDEVDRLFGYDYTSEVFQLFRAWYNERSSNPEMPWHRLTHVLVYATESHLAITNENVSPFNVGTKIELHDFKIEQVEELNERYGKPIQRLEDLKRFYDLLDGQPYLTRRGFYELTFLKRPLEQFFAEAAMDSGPFGDHLRSILMLVVRNPKTLGILTGMVHGEPIPDLTSFYGLRSGGLISGSTLADARFRCGIYKTYLTQHLS